MYKLLLDETPLFVLPTLAVRLGLNEAIVLQQVHYWLLNAREAERPGNYREGRWWVYNSYEEWQQKAFPFWSEKTVKRTFLALEETGVMVSAYLADNPADRRKWYTIDYDCYAKLVEKQSAQNGPVHQPYLGRWGGQNGPMGGTSCPDGRDKMGRSYKETENPAEITTETTAAETHSGVLQPLDSAAADLVLRLTEAGLNQSDAKRLAGSHPEECCRQLEYLPFVTSFKSSKGAYLRSAIEQGFGPPPGYEATQQAARKSENKRAKQNAVSGAMREADQQAEAKRAQVEREKSRLQSEEPDRWAQIVAEAEKLLPQPLRGKTSHVAYAGALNGNIERNIECLLATAAAAAAAGPSL